MGRDKWEVWIIEIIGVEEKTVFFLDIVTEKSNICLEDLRFTEEG